MMSKLKMKIKKKLKKYVKRMYNWIMETGNTSIVPAAGRANTSEKKAFFINDIKFNVSVDQNFDMETKRIMVSQMFYHKIGYYPNILKPKTFSEKVLWLKLFYEDPRITICSDKYNAKEYIDNILGQGYTVPVIKKYDNVCDINLEELPEKFVLKVNWCTGYNIIVTDKNAVDLEEIKAKLEFWKLPWKASYYGSFNWGYKNMKPIAFAEQYLDIPGNSTEYKLFCFNGRVNFFLVELDYFGTAPMRGYYSRNWEELSFQIEKIKKTKNVPKPDTYEEMIRIAEKLAEPFPYVRVDFYDIRGKLYVGEMTFYSGGGFSRIIPQNWDVILGEQLDITEAMAKMEEKNCNNEVTIND